MNKLANFSIETDQTVLLQFKNGQERRVPVDRLTDYLAGADFARVSAALQLRRNFIKTHMPKMSLAFIITAGSLAALLFTGGARVAMQLLQRAAPTMITHDSHAESQMTSNTPGTRHQAAGRPALADDDAQPFASATPSPKPGVDQTKNRAKASNQLPSLELGPLFKVKDQATDSRITPMPDAQGSTPSPSPSASPTASPSPQPGDDTPAPNNSNQFDTDIANDHPVTP